MTKILKMTKKKYHRLNTLRPRQNGRHFADDTFKHIFMNENVRISINISLKFVPKGLINNIHALVQTMAWRRPGDKPLSEPMMVNLLTHICVTRPQWVNPNAPSSRQWFYMLLFLYFSNSSLYICLNEMILKTLYGTQNCDSKQRLNKTCYKCTLFWASSQYNDDLSLYCDFRRESIYW